MNTSGREVRTTALDAAQADRGVLAILSCIRDAHTSFLEKMGVMPNVERMVEAGWLSLSEVTKYGDRDILPTDAGKLVHIEHGLDALVLNIPEGQDENYVRRMWEYLILNGSMVGHFGLSGYDTDSDPGGIFHLVRCGLDATVSGTPEIGTWLDHQGSFDEESLPYASGLTGKAVCACGKSTISLGYSLSDRGIAHLITTITR